MAKKLLKEQTIRRFMKLADIRPLTEEFVDRLSEQPEPEEGTEELAEPSDEAPDVEAPDVEEPDVEEPGAEDPLAGVSQEQKEALAMELIDRIGEVLDVDLETTTEEAEEGEEESEGPPPGPEAGEEGEVLSEWHDGSLDEGDLDEWDTPDPSGYAVEEDTDYLEEDYDSFEEDTDYLEEDYDSLGEDYDSLEEDYDPLEEEGYMAESLARRVTGRVLKRIEGIEKKRQFKKNSALIAERVVERLLKKR